MKKHITITAALAVVFCFCLALPAGADRLSANDKAVIEAAEAMYPGWKTTWFSYFIDYRGLIYEMNLMRAEDGMLRLKSVIAPQGDLAGNGWEADDHAPVPMTEQGFAEAECALETFDIECDPRLSTMELFLERFKLMPECAGFLLNEGETLDGLYPGCHGLTGVAVDAGGSRSLRFADWDGSSYGPAVTSKPEPSLYYNDIHSNDEYMELYGSWGECALKRGPDGVWRLVSFDSGDGGRYSITGDGLVDVGVTEWGRCSNDAWHYGVLGIGLALPEISFSSLPFDLEEAVALLDASGWACVKHDGAALCDAPNGKTAAACFARLPGRVVTQEEDWTQLQIGSEELGMTGWFRTDDLAFGAETEQVVCAFPGYDYYRLEETPLSAFICEKTGTDFYSFDVWLVGRTAGGNWLLLADDRLVCTASTDDIGETWPAQHMWEENFQ